MSNQYMVEDLNNKPTSSKMSIQDLQQFCKSIKVNPAKIFIDSNGNNIVTFHSKRHSDRYRAAITKHYVKLGLALLTERTAEVAAVSDNLWAEFDAPRH